MGWTTLDMVMKVAWEAITGGVDYVVIATSVLP